MPFHSSALRWAFRKCALYSLNTGAQMMPFLLLYVVFSVFYEHLNCLRQLLIPFLAFKNQITVVISRKGESVNVLKILNVLSTLEHIVKSENDVS